MRACIMESKRRKRYYEFVTPQEYHYKPVKDITSRAVWEGFQAQTTAHGIPHVKNARGVIKTTFWLLASLVCLVLLAYYGYLLFDKFFSYPFNVRVEVIHQKEMLFPAVTVCNHNPIRMDAVARSNDPFLRDLFGVPDVSGEPNSNGNVDPNNEQSETGSERGNAPGAQSGGTATGDQAGAQPRGAGTATGDQAGVQSGGSIPQLTGNRTNTQNSRSNTEQQTDHPGRKKRNVRPFPPHHPAPPIAATTMRPTTVDRHPEVSERSTDSTAMVGTVDQNQDLRDESMLLHAGDEITPAHDSTEVRQGGNSITLVPHDNEGGFQRGNIRGRNGRPQRMNFENFLQLQTYLASMPVPAKKRLSTQRDDFILDCEYSGAFCYASDFKEKYFNSVYGNCFTFNLGEGSGNSSLVEVSHRPGPKYGLSVIMNIDQDEYLGSIAQEAGVRLTVHDRKRMPFPEDEGISVLPGQITYVGIKLFTINRLSEPYGNCTDISRSQPKRNVYEERYGVKYSSNACHKTCYQYYIIHRCGCADPQFPVHGVAFGEQSYPVCSMQNESISSCLDSVTEDYQNDKLECKCPTACTQSTYTLSTSAAAWPSDRYKQELFRALGSTNVAVRDILNARLDPDKYKRNLVKVVVYFEEFNYEDVTEYPAYESFNLVSDLGGILGLFIGFSVMTIAEFIELGLDLLILNMINKCCCREKGKNTIGASNLSNPNSMKLEDIGDERIDSPPPPYYSSRAITPRQIMTRTKLR